MAINSPEGTCDLLPSEALFWYKFRSCAFETFSRYGYKPIETPLFEQTSLFVRGIGQATDVVSKEMFSAISGENLKRLLAGDTIKAKSKLSLRPEGTAGVVRAALQHNLVPQGAAPAKLMYAGQMFRAERPQKGRQRMFNQVGIECLGASAPSIDAEGIIMLMRFFEAVGVPLSSTILLLNSMGCENCRPAYASKLRKFLAAHEAELCQDCNRRADVNPLRAFDCKNPTCAKVMQDAPKISDYLCADCTEHFASVKALLGAAGINYVLDHKLVRGLDYYTRTVFEVQVNEGMGSQNAIGGGGRYDKLAEEIGGKTACPGFGFALGYERCKLAIEAAGGQVARGKPCHVFVACVDASVRAQAFAFVQQLRDAEISADLDHQNRSLKSQFKLADKLGCRWVAIFGPDELASGNIRIRNMQTHDEVLVALDALSGKKLWECFRPNETH